MRTATVLSIITTCISIISVQAQNYSLQSQACVGGSGYEYIYALEPVSDGGIISAGYTESSDGNILTNHGSGDCWLIRYNAGGDVIWSRTFGGSGYDYAYSVKETADGNFIVAGYTESSDGDISEQHGNGDMLLMLIDQAGNLVWSRSFGGSAADNGFAVTQSTDGTFVIAGSSMSSDGDLTINKGSNDVWIVKADAAGELVWQQSFGGSGADYASGVAVDAMDNLYVSGFANSSDGDVSQSFGMGDLWILQLSSAGSLLHEASLGGSGFDHGQSIITTPFGYYVAGYTESADGTLASNHGAGDAWALAFGYDHSLIWDRNMGSTANDYAYNIRSMADGSVMVSGYSGGSDCDVTQSFGDYDCWLVRLSASGIIIGEQSFGGSGTDIAYSVLPVGTTGLWLAGYSTSADGQVSGNHGAGDAWIVRTVSQSVNIQSPADDQIQLIISEQELSISSNTGLSSVELFDLSGRLCLKKEISGQNAAVSLADMQGVYIARIQLENGSSGSYRVLLNPR